MNIHDVARATIVAEEILAEHTTCSAAERLLLISAFQLRLIDKEITEPVAEGPTAGMGGGFTLKALTPRGADHIDEVQRLLLGLTRGDA